MNNFKLIQEHFTQLHCPNCDCSFTQESVKLIREEKDYWVVKVSCSNCNHSPGFAIVGIEYEEIEGNMDLLLNNTKSLSDVEANQNNLPPISIDDVIDAHKFIRNLGSDWAKYINKP